MSNQDFHRSGPHWTESEHQAKAPRGVLLTLLALFLLTAVGVYVYFVLQTPISPKTVFQAWIVSDYDDRVVLDLPFAEDNASKLVQRFGGGTLQLAQSKTGVAGLTTGSWESLDPERDVALIYLRAYGRAILDNGKPRGEILIQGFTGEDDPSTCVALSEIFAYCAQLPAASVVLMLDCGELEADPALGVLTNGFSQAIAEELRAGSGWDKLWVINSQSAQQSSHVSWRRQRTLLAASLLDNELGEFNVDEDTGYVSLAELYEGLLRDCDELTDGQQTPLLLRGGVGLLELAEENPDWGTAKTVPIARLTDSSSGAAESSDSEQDDTQNSEEAAPAGDSQQADSSAALAANEPGSASGQGEGEDEGAKGGSRGTEQGGAQSEAGESGAAAGKQPAAFVSARPTVSFRDDPLHAVWEARDQLESRLAYGRWSPADYAPALWQRIQYELISLEHQVRQGRRVSELADYHTILRYLLDPRQTAPAGSLGGLTRQLMDSFVQFQQSKRAEGWANEDDLPPGQSENWRAIQTAIQTYSSASTQEGWWLRLAERLRDQRMLSATERLHNQLTQFRRRLQPDDTTLDVSTSLANDLVGLAEQMTTELESLQSDMTEWANRDGKDWLRDEIAATLLTSPLPRWELRERLLERLKPDDKPASSFARVIPRREDLTDVWQRTRGNKVSDWSFVSQDALLRQQLLASLREPRDETTLREPSDETVSWGKAPTSLEGAIQWASLYRTQFRELGAHDNKPLAELSAELQQLRWERAALLGVELAKLQAPNWTANGPAWARQLANAAIIVSPRLDNRVRIHPTNDDIVEVPYDGNWRRFRDFMLRIPGRGELAQLRLRLRSPVVGNETFWSNLELSVKDPDGVWKRIDPLLIDSINGQSFEIAGSGKLEVRAKLLQAAQIKLNPNEPLVIPLEVLPAVQTSGREILAAPLTLTVRPPRPNQIDLWVTRQQPEERQQARRNLILSDDVLGSGEKYDLLAGARALVSIPGFDPGVPYRFWAENQSSEPRLIRACLYPIRLPASVAMRPGRLHFSNAKMPDELQDFISAVRRDRNGTSGQLPWAISDPVSLPAKSDQTLLTESEFVLPRDARLIENWTVQGAAPEGPIETLAPNGFLVLFEELEIPAPPAEGDAAAAPPAPQPQIKRGGDSWFKVVELDNHGFVDVTETADFDNPLVQLDFDPRRPDYDVARGRLEMRIERTDQWNDYQLEALPVELVFPTSAANDFVVQGNLTGELNAENARLLLSGQFSPRPRSIGSQIVALSLGGYPRRYYFELSLPPEGQPRLLPTPEHREVRITEVVPQLFDPEENQPRFSTINIRGDSNAIVLLNYRDIAGEPTEAVYDEMTVRLQVDAPWTAFQRFGVPAETDIVQVVLATEAGQQIDSQIRYAPRQETFTLGLDKKDFSVLRLTSTVTDHTFNLRLRSQQLDQGLYRVFGIIGRGSREWARSRGQLVIVDRTPPEAGSVEVRVNPLIPKSQRPLADGKLYAGQSFEVELATIDSLSQIDKVEFQLIRAGKTLATIEAGYDAEAGRYLGVIAAEALAAAPQGTCQVTALAIDAAGNRQTRHLPLEFQWTKQAPPEPTAGGDAGGGATAAMQLHQLTLNFKLDGGQSLRPEWMSKLSIKGLPGSQQIGGTKVFCTKIPTGEHPVVFSISLAGNDYELEETLRLPDQADQSLTLTLPAKK